MSLRNYKDVEYIAFKSQALLFLTCCLHEVCFTLFCDYFYIFSITPYFPNIFNNNLQYCLSLVLKVINIFCCVGLSTETGQTGAAM